MEDDRSALFNQLREFSQRKLKKVETKVVTGSGELLVEKRGAKGLQVLSGAGGAAGAEGQEPARKLDLQVGFILPGLLLGSQDVAHDKSSLETYGITHILNLDGDVEHKFEDDYNYMLVAIEDKADFDLIRILDECFDFIDDGRHYGNVLVHCSGTVGLSRSTSVCVAYLMSKENQTYSEAFNNVKEARSFVRPNEGFVKQLKEYEVKLRGAQAVKESGIDDPFALRKKQEIEQEKAMVAGASSVKNRMKMFGANLDTGAGPRSKSVSPSPYKQQPPMTKATANTTATTTQNSQNPAASRWSSQQAADKSSKSMTPEPRKSWQPSGPPPPPPPMPSSNLLGNDKPAATMKPASSSSTSTNKSSFPPPPPPPPPSSSSVAEGTKPAGGPRSRYQQAESKPPTSSQRKGSVSETSEDETGGKRVFGRRPPPPMKLRGGLSMERQDSATSDKQSDSQPASRRTNPPQLKQLHADQSRADQTPHCMTADVDQSGGAGANGVGSLRQRCASPLVLMNNVQTRPAGGAGHASPGVQSELSENPFKYWQRTLAQRDECSDTTADSAAAGGQLPKRTVSLGPKRSRQIGEGLQRSPFLMMAGGNAPSEQSSSTANLNRAAAAERRDSFSRAARELQSSLSELDKLIDDRPAGRGQVSSTTRPPLAGPPLPAPSRAKPPPMVFREPSQSASDEHEAKEPRFMWQEDLANWKSSSSVNNLLSLFEQGNRSASAAPTELPPAGGAPRARLNSTSVLKRTPWQNMEQQAGANHADPPRDYTIRRTTSTSSSLRDRPVLRNPYRAQ